MELKVRIELTFNAYKAIVLPLNYFSLPVIWSSRRDLNSQQSAWRADVLPLNYYCIPVELPTGISN